ncbi:MAG TPA: nitrate- and nitrite sensing domain-containing protein, partial [Acidimicrobiales bacterium]
MPLTALAIVTGLEVVNAASERQAVRDQTALAEISLGPSSILSALEEERNASGVYLLGMEDQFALEVEDPVEAAQITDATIEQFRAEVERQGPDIVEAYAPAFEAMDGLAELRATVTSTPDGSRTLDNFDAVAGNFDAFTEIMDSLAQTNRRVALAIDDAQLRQGAELVDLNSQQTNLVAILVRDLLAAAVGGDRDGVQDPDEIATIARSLSQFRTNMDLIVTTGTGRYAPLVEDLVAAEEVQRFPQVVDETLATSVVDLDAVTAYATVEDPEALAYTVFSRDVQETMQDHSNDLEAAATARLWWFVALAVTALVVAGLVAWLVSRSITRPLRSLTRQAKDMAERRLPDAVIDILETP